MKIDLGLDYEAILERINLEKEGVKPGAWANRVGVSINIVSNVHGKTKQRPSLEYIIAVSKATEKPVDYFLWGDEERVLNRNEPVNDSLYEPISEYGRNSIADADMIQHFKQTVLARELNRNAMILEKLNTEALKEVNDFIKFQIHKYQAK